MSRNAVFWPFLNQYFGKHTVIGIWNIVNRYERRVQKNYQNQQYQYFSPGKNFVKNASYFSMVLILNAVAKRGMVMIYLPSFFALFTLKYPHFKFWYFYHFFCVLRKIWKYSVNAMGETSKIKNGKIKL